MNVTIWGCRGSIARSHPDLIQYGGNTPCVEVEVACLNKDEDDQENPSTSTSTSTSTTRIVLDMGSGAYDLGQKLAKLGPLKDQHILLTHCHWDHIQGFPLFAPFFIPNSQWCVHAPGGFTTSLKEKMASQMSYEFFPLTIDMLGADIEYQDLTEGQLQFGNIHVTCQYLNHPVLTLGYRLYHAQTGTSMAYITDHEPFNTYFATEGYTRSSTINPNDGSNTTPENGDDRHVDFIKGVDLLIHDTQYTATEYGNGNGNGKMNWGHSTVEYVVDIAMAAQVQTLLLFHHDPLRTDSQVEEIVQLAQQRVQNANNNSKLVVMAAADRAEIHLPPKPHSDTMDQIQAKVRDGLSESAQVQPMQQQHNQRVLIHHPNKDIFNCLVEDEAIKIMHVEEGDSIVQTMLPILDGDNHEQEPPPSVILLSFDIRNSQGDVIANAMEICQQIRQQGGPCGQDVPIIIVAKDHDQMEANQEQAAASGVTDWIVGLMTPAFLRTRVRMAIARSPCRWVPSKIPRDEIDRLAALEALNISTETSEEQFESIVKLVQAALGVPFAALNFILETQQVTKACSCPMGFRPEPVSRDQSFCSHAIVNNDLLIVNDTKKDYRFADNPMVSGEMNVRFYVGCPISVPAVLHQDEEGHYGREYNVASLCLMDFKPRRIDEQQQEMLRGFGRLLRRELIVRGKPYSSVKKS